MQADNECGYNSPPHLLQLLALSSKLGLEVGDHAEGGGGVQGVLGVVHGAQVEGVVIAVQQLLHEGLVVNHACGLRVILQPAWQGLVSQQGTFSQ